MRLSDSAWVSRREGPRDVIFRAPGNISEIVRIEAKLVCNLHFRYDAFEIETHHCVVLYNLTLNTAIKINE